MASPRLLVVDDSPPIGRLIERLLGDEFVIEHAADGALAIAKLEGGATYDVLILDLAMPVMDGRELYELVRERFPELLERIVFLTGGPLSADDDRFLQGVPNVVVEKPFDKDALRDLIRRTAGLTT